MTWRAEAVAGLALLAAGGILGWTAVLMALFHPWPRRAPPRLPLSWPADLSDTLPRTRPLPVAGPGPREAA